MKSSKNELPLINVRDHVIFPNTTSNLFIGRKFTISALMEARNTDQLLIVASQKKGEKDEPKKLTDMYEVGTLCKLAKSVSFPDDTMKVKVEGICPVTLTELNLREGVRHVKFKKHTPQKVSSISGEQRQELVELLVRWHPSSAIDPERNTVQELTKSQSDKLFLKKLLQSFMYFPKLGVVTKQLKSPSPAYAKEINASVASRQKVIEASTGKKQIELIRSILIKESMQTLKHLDS